MDISGEKIYEYEFVGSHHEYFWYFFFFLLLNQALDAYFVK